MSKELAKKEEEERNNFQCPKTMGSRISNRETTQKKSVSDASAKTQDIDNQNNASNAVF